MKIVKTFNEYNLSKTINGFVNEYYYNQPHPQNQYYNQYPYNQPEYEDYNEQEIEEDKIAKFFEKHWKKIAAAVGITATSLVTFNYFLKKKIDKYQKQLSNINAKISTPPPPPPKSKKPIPKDIDRDIEKMDTNQKTKNVTKEVTTEIFNNPKEMSDEIETSDVPKETKKSVTRIVTEIPPREDNWSKWKKNQPQEEADAITPFTEFIAGFKTLIKKQGTINTIYTKDDIYVLDNGHAITIDFKNQNMYNIIHTYYSSIPDKSTIAKKKRIRIKNLKIKNATDKEIPLINFIQITDSIDISENNLKQFDPIFMSQKNIDVALIANFNAFTSFKYMPTTPKVYELQNCNLTSLPDFPGKKLPKDSKIFLSYNKLNNINGLPNAVDILVATHNMINDSNLKDLPKSANTIDVSFNTITSLKNLPKFNNTKFMVLNLQNNNISNIEGLPKDKFNGDLILSNNRLSDVEHLIENLPKKITGKLVLNNNRFGDARYLRRRIIESGIVDSTNLIT